MYENEIHAFLERHHYSRVTPRAALIDMDGTLYDSMPHHAAAWHRMVTELGIPSNPDDYYLWEGRTGASVINELFQRTYGRDATADEVKRYYTTKTEYFRAMPPVDPMPGAADMLKILCDIGVKCVLVTGSGQDSLLSRLDTDFPGVFPAGMRVTAHDVEYGKPHPEPFIRALQRAGVSPSQAIAIDNAPLGVESAARAGVFAVGVVTGPIPEQAMRDAGANVVFPSMKECAQQMPLLIYQLVTHQLI